MLMFFCFVYDLFSCIFGYDDFCGLQQVIVEYVVVGNDVFVLMFMGGGKLLCYQVFFLLCDGIGIVIFLLIVFMQDQVDVLCQLGVCVEYFNFMFDVEIVVWVEWELVVGELELLYVVLEWLFIGCFLFLLVCSWIVLFVIDEVYCVL